MSHNTNYWCGRTACLLYRGAAVPRILGRESVNIGGAVFDPASGRTKGCV